MDSKTLLTNLSAALREAQVALEVAAASANCYLLIVVPSTGDPSIESFDTAAAFTGAVRKHLKRGEDGQPTTGWLVAVYGQTLSISASADGCGFITDKDGSLIQLHEDKERSPASALVDLTKLPLS